MATVKAYKTRAFSDINDYNRNAQTWLNENGTQGYVLIEPRGVASTIVLTMTKEVHEAVVRDDKFNPEEGLGPVSVTKWKAPIKGV